MNQTRSAWPVLKNYEILLVELRFHIYSLTGAYRTPPLAN